ncbi:polymer-forming cytoskeletal protein [Anaerotalea alkaliphila]|uniref:Polymer-forming cytoskeletal protein n=1 Tax=Anaerotalea alkaliphila TaxID=2662126 RepID=A0A7X5HVQ7_9FIRM|nr:polymer-forming cytoskeletal protein [Anaerotalea alkaliphila]NDL67453.1 polymer-forming cytoskeletal protein [Anaerotalea alkaliphila]
MYKGKRKRQGKGLLLAVAALLAVTVLSATGYGRERVVRQEVTFLEKGVFLDGPGFFAGTSVRVEGDVEGTTFASGQDVVVNGNINGDLFVAGQTVTINGKVEGNIYCAGQNLSLGMQNTGDVFAAGQEIRIGQGAVVGRDLFAAGYRIVQNGVVGRDFNSGASVVGIGGSVGRDANLDASVIEIGDGAMLEGDLSYRSEREAEIAPGSRISGEQDWTYVDRTPEKRAGSTMNMLRGKLVSRLLGIASALLLWFVIRLWKPEFWNRTAELVQGQPLKTLGIGAIALVMTPILVILVMVTVIGIPLGVLLGIAYGVSLYLSKIVAAVFIGSWLAKRFGWTEIHKGVWLVLLGLVVVTALGMVPIVRVLVWLLVVFAGLGAIIGANGRTTKPQPEEADPLV